MELMILMRGEKLFTWEGTTDELARLRQEMPGGLAPDIAPIHFALSAADYVARNGLPEDETQRRGTMAWLTYLVVEQPTRDPARPGKFGDYLAGWNFTFDLDPQAGRCEIRIVGDPSAEGVA
jgi:hypothetical protein